MKPRRIQLSRKKGWRMPAGTISVARPSEWGNPWKVGLDGDVIHCIAEYRRLLEVKRVTEWPKDKAQKARAFYFATADGARYAIRGFNLACWCALDQPCHADVLLELANKD